MRRSALLLSLLLVVTAMAGCTGGKQGAGGAGNPDTPALEATSTTGVIRAVVVDEAIRPLAGVNVTVKTDDGPQTKATDANGFAGFEGLPAGTYFLKAVKRGYVDAQQSVEVVAGVGDPPVAKLLLQPRTGDQAFFEEYKYDGFLECSAAIGNWCFIANYYPCLVERTAGQPCTGNLTNDNSFFSIPSINNNQRVPDFLQLEMAWQSTQSLGSQLQMRADFKKAADVTIEFSKAVQGPSPLPLMVNHTLLQKYGLGVDHTLEIETFHYGPQTVCDTPVGPSCQYAGAAVQQQFTDFVHVFYGYTPPEGWMFSTDGTVPQPP